MKGNRTMNKEFFAALDALEKEKGIPKDYMLEKIEAALVSALRKEYGETFGFLYRTMDVSLV